MAWISQTMHKRQPVSLSSPALPADKVAERLRAHARLCRQIARESRNESIAIELARIADECLEAAENLGPEPGTLLH